MSRNKLPKDAERAIARFKRRLTSNYPDAVAYLFGSYADGTWLSDSDFDIVVVSKRFEYQPLAERVAAVRHLAPKGRPFEILAYTPTEFHEALKRSVVIRDARRYWRRIT